MLPGIGGAPEVRKIPVVLRELQRPRNVKAAAELAQRAFQIAVLQRDGLASRDAVIADDAPPKPHVLHRALPGSAAAVCNLTAL